MIGIGCCGGFNEAEERSTSLKPLIRYGNQLLFQGAANQIESFESDRHVRHAGYAHCGWPVININVDSVV